MGRYAAGDVTIPHADTTTIASLTAPATGMVRAFLYEVVIGSNATPADEAATYQINRCITAGTAGTTVAGEPLDPADAAPVTVAGFDHSADPTTVANSILAVWSVNQRATFRWVAAPGGEIVVPATATNGIEIESIDPTTTFGCEITLMWEE